MQMKRLPEIDFARGMAVIFMVLFNWSFTLSFLNVYTLPGGFFYWWLFPRIIGGTFIFLAGLSLILSYNRVKTLEKRKIWAKLISRGFKICLIAIGITAATIISYPQYTIYFGILHLIGLSIVLSVIFLKFNLNKLFLGVPIFISGFFLQSLTFDTPFFLLFGLAPHNFQTFDYWPLFPWFGLFLMGMCTGDFYSKKKSLDKKRILNFPLLKQICFLGKKSLVIYLVHQPVLLALLYIFGFRI